MKTFLEGYFVVVVVVLVLVLVLVSFFKLSRPKNSRILTTTTSPLFFTVAYSCPVASVQSSNAITKINTVPPRQFKRCYKTCHSFVAQVNLEDRSAHRLIAKPSKRDAFLDRRGTHVPLTARARGHQRDGKQHYGLGRWHGRIGLGRVWPCVWILCGRGVEFFFG